jgi:hypothetical protein
MMNEDVYICDMTRAAESVTGEMHAEGDEMHHLHADMTRAAESVFAKVGQRCHL